MKKNSFSRRKNPPGRDGFPLPFFRERLLKTVRKKYGSDSQTLCRKKKKVFHTRFSTACGNVENRRESAKADRVFAYYFPQKGRKKPRSERIFERRAFQDADMTCQKPFPTCRSGASRGKRGEILLLFHGDSMGVFPLRKRD